MSINDSIERLKKQAAFLERAHQKFPDLRKEGHYLISLSVNAIAEHVDIQRQTWPYAIPYVLFEDEPVFSQPMMFGLATDEGYTVEWKQEMTAHHINSSIIAKTESLIQSSGYEVHYETVASKNFWVDVWYGSRRFGY
jgi:hypothetical protein